MQLTLVNCTKVIWYSPVGKFFHTFYYNYKQDDN